MDLIYGLNQDDKIVATNDAWDNYALNNGGSRCVSRLVMYRSIWDFVAGDELREFLGTVFDECRSQGSDFSTLSRSDAPGTFQLMQMTVQSGDLGMIYVQHVLVAKRKKVENEPVNLARFRCPQKCSVCTRIKVGEEWVSFQAVPDERMFPLNHTICPTCEAMDNKSQTGRESDIQGAGTVLEFRKK